MLLRFHNILSIFLFALFLMACSAHKDSVVKLTDPKQLYDSGVKSLLMDRFTSAIKDFSTIEREHPASSIAADATMLKTYAYYKDGNFDDAVLSANDFIRKYPASKYVDYIYYMKALSLLNQSMSFDRDQKVTLDALNAFDEFMLRFPNSRYYASAVEKRASAYNTIAAREMFIGRFYLRMKHISSAIPKFRSVILAYGDSILKQEAMYRMVECYVALGILDQAKYYAAALQAQYHNTKWNTMAQDLLKKN